MEKELDDHKNNHFWCLKAPSNKKAGPQIKKHWAILCFQFLPQTSSSGSWEDRHHLCTSYGLLVPYCISWGNWESHIFLRHKKKQRTQTTNWKKVWKHNKVIEIKQSCSPGLGWFFLSVYKELSKTILSSDWPHTSTCILILPRKENYPLNTS